MAEESIPWARSQALSQVFYPASVIVAVLVLLTVYVVLPTKFVIFGLYGFLGISLGAVIYYTTSTTNNSMQVDFDGPTVRTGVYVTAAVTLGTVALTGEPLVVAVGLALGYALVVLQLVSDAEPVRLLPQLTALFLLSPLVKYLTSGYYRAHGDIIIHARFVEDVMAAGSLDAIAYSTYLDFPGLHALASTFGSLSGLGAYDSLMLAGIASYVIVVPMVYLIVEKLLDDSTLALYTAFAVAALDTISFYAGYAFPQSFATVLMLFLVVLLGMSSRDAIKWPVTGMVLAVAVTLSVTHHLTQVLFFPLLVLGVAIYVVQDPRDAASVLRSRYVALAGLVATITGVRLLQTGFFGRLADKAALVLAGGTRGGYSQSLSFEYGTSPSAAALEWLVSPYGVYLIVLLAVFSIGVVNLVQYPRRKRAYTALALLGVMSSVLFFDSPISIKSLGRVRAPWAFAFAFVFGIGLLEVRRRVRDTGWSRLLVVALVLLAALGPLVTADNYYGLDPRPSPETSFSEQDAAEFDAVSGYVAASGATPTTFWNSRLVMEKNDVTELGYARIEDGELTIPRGGLVYRTKWSEHGVQFSTVTGEKLYADTLYISDQRLSECVAARNKVYSAGGTGIVWADEDRTFGSC